MSKTSRLLLASAMAVVFTPLASALAADYDPPIIVDKAPEFVPVEVGNGWYLRGDIGYTFGTEAEGPISYRMFNAGVYTPAATSISAFDDNYTWGVGAGYQFNRWLRADATFDGQENDFASIAAVAAPCAGGAVGDVCGVGIASTATTYSVLANVYGDLGTYAGFTPYVGAGAGMSRVRWNDVASLQTCVGPGCPAVPAPVINSHNGEASWRFTYALMAGLAYNVSKNLKVDVGYRYKNIAGGDMFNFDAASAAAGATGIQATDDGFSQHEVRVGLRYSLW